MTDKIMEARLSYDELDGYHAGYIRVEIVHAIHAAGVKTK